MVALTSHALGARFCFLVAAPFAASMASEGRGDGFDDVGEDDDDDVEV